MNRVGYILRISHILKQESHLAEFFLGLFRPISGLQPKSSLPVSASSWVCGEHLHSLRSTSHKPGLGNLLQGTRKDPEALNPRRDDNV